MIHLDTSVLVDALTGARRSAAQLRGWGVQGERVGLSTVVLYEWLRGPRTPLEIQAQEALFPAASATPFGPMEAALAADLYRVVRRARGREIDLAIAACALTQGATLWTVNRRDFSDIPRLRLA